MSFFGKKITGVLGVDIGASSVKLVELAREGGRVHLKTYGFTEEDAVQPGDPRHDAKRTGAVLRELLRQAHTSARKTIASLPTFSVFSSIIHLPELGKKELPDAIRWEAKKLIPLPLEEMLLNWEILKELPPGMRSLSEAAKSTGDVQESLVIQKKKGKSINVLITAAERKLVGQYVAIFKEAGLELASLETEAFALVRSLVGNDASAIMIIDIGGKNTDLSLIDGGVPILNRSIDFGGRQVTDVFATSLDLSPATAEQVKRDLSLSKYEGALPQKLHDALAPLVNEVNYTRGVYQSESGKRTIEKIVLTGGSSWLTSLVSYLTETFHCTVTVGDPWARVAVPVDLAPILQEIGPRMSVAVGLAMRDV